MQLHLQTHVPPEHSSPLEQAATVDEHLHTLLSASQYAPVDEPTQEEVVPHIQDPEVHDSPELLHALPVPHLHTPLSQVSVVPVQAETVAEHLHTLFVASQRDPDASPAQVEAVPHLQDPELQVSPALSHAVLVPHLHTPLSQVSVVPLQAETVDEHLQTLFVASQYDPDV
jgi:hypothetical protein